ncbi:MAG: hypothetical protein DWB45_04600 [Xanthomonadales bacterium]|nr:hypothetical protein [Xanthomonadales bacterium]MDL1869250.1 hypothetical protein [Gammaproteobacteria bacterium PRO6]
MPSMRHAPLAILLSLAALPATAANLITNPNFTTDISAWSAIDSGTTLAFDASKDANDSPASGSLAISSNGSGGLAATQCIASPVGSEFSFGAKILVGGAMMYGMTCEAYASSDCSGSMLDSADAAEGAPAPNEWIPFDSASPFQLPNGTNSVLCRITAMQPVKRAGTDTPQGTLVSVWADDVYFGPGTTPVSLQTFIVD